MKASGDDSIDGLAVLTDALSEQGKPEEFEALAVKEALASQIAEAMKAQNLSRKRLAERMKTSQSQVSRLLDPMDKGPGNQGNVSDVSGLAGAKLVPRYYRTIPENAV
jgi:antitoxin HicB